MPQKDDFSDFLSVLKIDYNSNGRAFKEDTYDTNYTLNQGEIIAAACFKLSAELGITPQQARENYVILPARQTHDGSLQTEDLDDAINAAATGTPSFLIVGDDRHYVTIALYPELDKDGNVASISIMNINPITPTIPQNEGKSFLETGSAAAQQIREILNARLERIEVKPTIVRNNVEQQHGNCCGLSAAMNIASIVTHHSQKRSADSIDESLFHIEATGNYDLDQSLLKTEYQAFGSKVFHEIEKDTHDVNRVMTEFSDDRALGMKLIAEDYLDILSTKGEEEANTALKASIKAHKFTENEVQAIRDEIKTAIDKEKTDPKWTERFSGPSNRTPGRER